VLCALLVGGLMLVVPAAAHGATIVVNDVTVTEGNGATTATFTLTRSAGILAPPVSVSFTTADGSARSPADFVAASGTRDFARTLVFPETQVATVAVPVVGDRLDEPNESFRLVVSGAEVTDGEGVGTIVDDDPQPAVGVADAAPATEGGSASFAVGLSARSGRDVTVAFATADGSATAGQDYTARSGTLTIPAGSAGATVAVPVLDDSADEPSEGFELRLSAPTAATLGDGVAAATILDNDEPPAVGLPPPVAPVPQPALTLPILPPVTTGSSATRLTVGSPRLRQPGTGLVTITCPQAAGGCSGQVTLFSRPNQRSAIKQLRRERRLGQRTFTLVAGATQTLTFALGRSDRRLLERAGRIDVRAYAVTKDGSGRTDVRTASGTLLRRTAHSSPSPSRRSARSLAAGQRLDVVGGPLGAVVGGRPVA
jgi:hypothetical protein